MIYIRNNKRINIYAPFTDSDGTRYANLDSADVRARLGVSALPEPTPPEDFSDDLYYRTEQDEAPYVIYTRKSDEQIAEVQMQRAKVTRTQAVRDIIVTTQAGNSFDGHEDAQNRMSRAINGLDDDTETVPWVLADNSVALVNRVELKEALRLSGIAQTEAWVRPYTQSV